MAEFMLPSQSIRFDYTGAPQSIKLLPGIYILECIGASGGNDNGTGGCGGYAKGKLSIFSPTTLYCYVGGAGLTSVSGRGGGWNGGGNAGVYGTSGGGGGGTDIRLNDSLYSRIIVAGGGGGGGCSSPNNGGSGGGIEGQNVASHAAGTQTSGAAFGIGSACEASDGGGGGGGWYGGRGAYGDHGGAGGSGYAWTKDTKIYYPVGCQVPDTLFLEETELISGYNQRLANGYAIITFVNKIEARKNSNVYKNIREQSVFDLLQLLGE